MRLYAVLVVVPALGIAGALHAGRSLEAPPSVGGIWRIVPDAEGCARAAGRLVIAQSGRRLEGQYAPAGRAAASLRGRLEAGSAVLDGKPEGCEQIQVSLGGSRPAATVQTGACGCRSTLARLERAAAP